MPLLPWRRLADELADLAAPVTGKSSVTIQGAAGRVLATDVTALRALPPLSHAVMDGYALGSVPPGRFRLLEGEPEKLGLADAMAVAAGRPVPIGTAAVVLADKAQRDGHHIHVVAAQAKSNIRRAGEEADVGSIVLRAGQQLDARHIALAAAAGVSQVDVVARPRVAVLALHDGIDHLPHLAVAQALLTGGALQMTAAAAVRADRLAPGLARAAGKADLVVCVSDSLGDEAGPLATAIKLAGGAPRVLRAAMKPAKPIVIGHVDRAKIVGLSGTAYAVTIAGHLFLRPLLRKLAGLPADAPFREAALDFSRSREPGRAEALPVRADSASGKPRLSSAGRFGQLTALAAMDGFALIAAEAATMEPGAECLYHPLLMPLV